MGCGVPDAGSPNTTYEGFGKQVWYGAESLHDDGQGFSGASPRSAATAPLPRTIRQLMRLYCYTPGSALPAEATSSSGRSTGSTSQPAGSRCRGTDDECRRRRRGLAQQGRDPGLQRPRQQRWHGRRLHPVQARLGSLDQGDQAHDRRPASHAMTAHTPSATVFGHRHRRSTTPATSRPTHSCSVCIDTRRPKRSPTGRRRSGPATRQVSPTT